jgi:hypothetical protein
VARDIFNLNFDGASVFDGSVIGNKIKSKGKLAGDSQSLFLGANNKTTLHVGHGSSLEKLDGFSVEFTAEFKSTQIAQTIFESQTPPMHLKIDLNGTLIGEVNTTNGAQTVKSDHKIPEGVSVNIRFLREKTGKLALEIDDKPAGSARSSGKLKALGSKGMTIGARLSGENNFQGSLSRFQVFDGPRTAKGIASAKRKFGIQVRDVLDKLDTAGGAIEEQGEVDHRFSNIKSIMQGAGVSDLSKLTRLSINRRTRIMPGTILRAQEEEKGRPVATDWSAIATKFVGLTGSSQKNAATFLNSQLLTRSSGTTTAIKIEDIADRQRVITPAVRGLPTTMNIARPINPVFGSSSISGIARLASHNTTTLRPTLRNTISMPNVLLDDTRKVSAIEGLKSLEKNEPGSWPVFNTATMHMMVSNTLPVNSAVIIARRLDLTNQTLEIDPAVGTLYIIAEEVEAANGASIVWKRETISTPNRGIDPALDGLDRHGVDLAPNSKHGLPGGDASNGSSGVQGYPGRSAPNVEIWALRMNGMPDIDLSGQDGGQGGLGQRGGEGGRGAQGRVGEWYWLLGKRCWEDPGNGGDGGDGGDGGRGGRGGSGGGGGSILFAILPQTLSELTTTNSFTADLSGGERGDGGNGGLRGEGGPGGRRGFTSVCDQARDGARGQPGRVGAAGSLGGTEGDDGQISIMTVTQESWDEQLTRPWLYDVTPNSGLPGTSVIVKGSRFADTDELIFDSAPVTSTLRADGGLNAVIPIDATGGQHTIYTRRHDGQESNRLSLTVRPQLTGSLPAIAPGTTVTLNGRAFLAGATVEYNGGIYPAELINSSRLNFIAPDAAGHASTEASVGLAVVNPDGQRSNTLMAQVSGVLKNGFQIGVHDFNFENDDDGRPNWGTFEDTFGSVEVWHELLDPIFGHPILTTAFYFFYEHFLDGESNGGLATGFCTSLASIALDRFWQGHNDTFTSIVRDDAFREQMTAIHGRLLSRESLLSFHDQGRRGNANVLSTFRNIESIFQSGGTRETAPMLFFVPAGAAWDAGYFDMLSDSHCIVPTRIVYPTGYTAGDPLDGVILYCWDNNHPNNQNCFVEFRTEGGETLFSYTANGSIKFDSTDSITLAIATLGEYLLRDVDLPFGGPLGLTTFIFDFLLSPAELTIHDDLGRITGHVGGQILSEIPDSLPAYLMKGAFLLPQNVGLTRRITGTATGTYGYHSVSPEGLSIGMKDISTSLGQTDRVLGSADGGRVRFIPGSDKLINMTLGRHDGSKVRGLSIENFASTPTSDLDVTMTPDLSLVRIANQGTDANLDVKLLNFDTISTDRRAMERNTISVPSGSDLVVAVTNWDDLIDANVTTSIVSV